MTYIVKIDDKAKKQLKKLDLYTRSRLLRWLNEHVNGSTNSRQHGKALVGNKKGYWRYRVGRYRIISDIQDDKLIVLAVEVSYCKDVYK